MAVSNTSTALKEVKGKTFNIKNISTFIYGRNEEKNIVVALRTFIHWIQKSFQFCKFIIVDVSGLNVPWDYSFHNFYSF